LKAPEFRWYAEEALDARAEHDAEDEPASIPESDDEDGPGFAPLAVLTRNRLATLPPARRPRGAVPSPHGMDEAELFSAYGLLLPGQLRPQPAKLPAKRKKSDGPAPVHQIKVSL